MTQIATFLKKVDASATGINIEAKSKCIETQSDLPK
jgi:hypothetical protein